MIKDQADKFQLKAKVPANFLGGFPSHLQQQYNFLRHIEMPGPSWGPQYSFLWCPEVWGPRLGIITWDGQIASECSSGDFEERGCSLGHSRRSDLFSWNKWCEGIPVCFFKASKGGIEREINGTQQTPCPSLAYLEFSTLEGVCGLNQRPSFALISATNFIVVVQSLSQKSPLSQKLYVILC